MNRPRRKTPKPLLLHIYVEAKEQQTLRAIATSLGLLIPSGKDAGLGSISALVVAIARQQKIRIAKNMSVDGNPTRIYSKDNTLSFDGEYLATRQEYQLALGKGSRRYRPVGSIFEALNPGENIQLADGYFVLDDYLDLVQDWQII